MIILPATAAKSNSPILVCGPSSRGVPAWLAIPNSVTASSAFIPGPTPTSAASQVRPRPLRRCTCTCCSARTRPACRRCPRGARRRGLGRGAGRSRTSAAAGRRSKAGPWPGRTGKLAWCGCGGADGEEGDLDHLREEEAATRKRQEAAARVVQHYQEVVAPEYLP